MGLSSLLLLLLLPLSIAPLAGVDEALERGRPDLALEELRRLEEQDPEAYRINRLPYLQAALLQESGRHSEAYPIFKSLRSESFPLQTHLAVRLIETSGSQPFAERVSLYSDFLERFPSDPRWAEKALEFGRLLETAGRIESALEVYDRLWAAKKGRVSRTAAYRHALTHLQRSQKSEAVRDLFHLLDKGTRDDIAFQASRDLRRLVPLPELSETETRQLASVFMHNRESAIGREYLQRLIGAFPSSTRRQRYAYLWGRSYVIEGDYAKAVEAYEKAYRQYPDSDWGVFCKYLSGNTSLRLQDYTSAVAAYRRVIEDHPKSRYLARARYNLADSYRWLGNPRAAERVAKESLTVLPPRERNRFRYYLARLAVDEENYSESLGYLEDLDHLSSRRLPSGVTREEIHFWKGHCLSRLGRPKEAAEAFAEAASAPPNFFAFLAEARIPTSPVEGTKNWNPRLLRGREFLTAPDGLRSWGPVDRIRELIFLRRYGEAALEIKRLGVSRFPLDRRSYWYTLAVFLGKGGQAQASIQAADRLRQYDFPRTLPHRYPPALAELLYPRHFGEIAREAAKEWNVDPDLILSVIRQESLFQPDAKSSASARGLMQFMHSMATRLASELGKEAPAEQDLYRPDLSIELGAYHLRRLLDRFDGSLEKALAAYNGGAENVERWAAKSPRGGAVEFVSNIGFRETKIYVLRVMGNYWSYGRIYGNRVPLTLPEEN